MKAPQKLPFVSAISHHYRLQTAVRLRLFADIFSVLKISYITMQITLNGEQIATAGQTLHEMVLEKGFNPDTVIAEVNLQLIKKEDWQQTVLAEGDTVELLSFVGGG